MEYINLDDILFRHLIKFEYDVSGAYYYKRPHHLFKIENSIHYKVLETGDFTDYNLLVTTTNQKEHSEEAYNDLINNFDLNQFETNKMRIFYDTSLKKFVIKDGCHRLAIIKHRDLVENGNVPVDWFKIE